MIFAEDGMEKKKRYLLYWAVVCLLVFIIGAAIPRSEMRSLGLEGANQANLKNATEELTEGKDADIYGGIAGKNDRPDRLFCYAERT